MSPLFKSQILDSLRVRLQEPTALGRLYYQNYPSIESSITFIRSAIRRQDVYTINLDSTVIFGVDQDKRLKDVDFMISKSIWKVAPVPEPQPLQAADIVFTEVQNEHAYLVLPIRVVTNESKTYAHIVFDEEEPEGDWIALSEQCLALIAEDQLKGFHIWLNRSP
jgi:hypothetical protein